MLNIKKESAVPIELKIYGGGRVAFYQIKQARAKSGAILQDAVEPVKANIARVSVKGKPCDESCPLHLSNAERRLGNPSLIATSIRSEGNLGAAHWGGSFIFYPLFFRD